MVSGVAVRSLGSRSINMTSFSEDAVERHSPSL